MIARVKIRIARSASAATIGSAVKRQDKQDADGTRKDEEQSGVCRSKNKDVLLRTLYAVGLSGSEIVGKNSLSSAGDTAERHGDYEHEALGNGLRR